jgi:hypothetical protein
MHRIVEGALRNVTLENEVRILGRVRPGVEGNAGAAGQNGAYAATSELPTDDDGDLR